MTLKGNAMEVSVVRASHEVEREKWRNGVSKKGEAKKEKQIMTGQVDRNRNSVFYSDRWKNL